MNVRGLASFDHNKLTRKMGTLSAEQMNTVKSAIRVLLQI